MKAGTRIAIALSCALTIGAIAAIPAGASPASAAASKSACSVSPREERNLGADYVYSINVRDLSCDRAKKLVVKFHQCRHDHGGPNGHCAAVEGYSCTEKGLDSSDSFLQAKAKCTKGSKQFKQTFGEFL